MDTNEQISRAEAAEILGISRGTLYKWGLASKGPRFYVLGDNIVYYLRSEVIAWKDANTVCVEPEGNLDEVAHG